MKQTTTTINNTTAKTALSITIKHGRSYLTTKEVAKTTTADGTKRSTTTKDVIPYALTNQTSDAMTDTFGSIAFDLSALMVTTAVRTCYIASPTEQNRTLYESCFTAWHETLSREFSFKSDIYAHLDSYLSDLEKKNGKRKAWEEEQAKRQAETATKEHTYTMERLPLSEAETIALEEAKADCARFARNFKEEKEYCNEQKEKNDVYFENVVMFARSLMAIKRKYHIDTPQEYTTLRKIEEEYKNMKTVYSIALERCESIGKEWTEAVEKLEAMPKFRMAKIECIPYSKTVSTRYGKEIETASRDYAKTLPERIHDIEDLRGDALQAMCELNSLGLINSVADIWSYKGYIYQCINYSITKNKRTGMKNDSLYYTDANGEEQVRTLRQFDKDVIENVERTEAIEQLGKYIISTLDKRAKKENFLAVYEGAYIHNLERKEIAEKYGLSFAIVKDCKKRIDKILHSAECVEMIREIYF